MSNFKITFLRSPWWMLLIIAAALITFIPYFRLAKRYRRTRNRIISIVLHLLVSVCVVCFLAGLQFTYETPNDKNEIILLVDVSDSQEEYADRRDMFVENVLNDSKYENFRVGLVAFGFDHTCVTPMTTDVESIFSQYSDFLDEQQSNAKVDESATNLADALTYVKTMFTYPETGKVIIISDGKQTDKNAQTIIRSLTAKGTKIDGIYLSDDSNGGTGQSLEREVQVCDITLPQEYILLETETTINVKVNSTQQNAVTFALYDNGERIKNGLKTVVAGEQELSFSHTFKGDAFHEISVKISCDNDTVEQNNEYYTYVFIEKFDKILLIETYDGDSDKLESLLTGDQEEVQMLFETQLNYNVTKVKVGEPDFPQTIDDLLVYDQVILNNVANADLPSGFINILYSFVNDYGGGMLTIGGNEPDVSATEGSGKVHVYDRNDLAGGDGIYQSMLPIDAIDYTPPLGVVVVMDTSASMMMPDASGVTKLERAKSGVETALYALTERDYFALLTFDTYYGTVLKLTPATQENKIKEAIRNMPDKSGGTTASNAIERAASMLNANESIDRRHIILITDGIFGDKPEDYLSLVEKYYKDNDITFSVMGIDMVKGDTNYTAMEKLVQTGGGNIYARADLSGLGNDMYKDLTSGSIKDVILEDFNPKIERANDSVLNGLEAFRDEDGNVISSLDFTVSGFYGGKLKKDAVLVLSGQYRAPFYCYRTLGKGVVGSIMCDLKGTETSYSQNFYTSVNGQRLIYNIVRELMPKTRLVAGDVNVALSEENYINSLSVYQKLSEGDKIEGTIQLVTGSEEEAISLLSVTPEDKRVDAGVYIDVALCAENNYSKCTFIVKEAGVYKITVTYTAADGTQKKTEIYKTFSYSAEYDCFVEDTGLDLMTDLAEKGNGSLITRTEDLSDIFKTFVTTIQHVYDPRFLFMILSLIMFLIDIAVRKFKFKWIHEIIREKRKGNEE